MPEFYVAGGSRNQSFQCRLFTVIKLNGLMQHWKKAEETALQYLIAQRSFFVETNAHIAETCFNHDFIFRVLFSVSEEVRFNSSRVDLGLFPFVAGSKEHRKKEQKVFHWNRFQRPKLTDLRVTLAP